MERIGDFVTIERDGGVAVVRFDRGDRINALSLNALRQLRMAAERLRDDTGTHAVILTGTPVFTAGADLKDAEAEQRAEMGLIERRQSLRHGPDACDAWARLEQLTIAAIEGFCLGGGVSLAVSCDLRVASRGAELRLPEIPLGMNMSWHTVPRLVNLIGPARTKRFVMFGEKLGAADAQAWGLVDELTEDGSALDAALGLARKAATLPPLGVRMTKEAVDAAAAPLNAATTFADRDLFLLATSTEEHREAVGAFRNRKRR